MFNDEIDLLKKRLNYLKNIVDVFVICESKKTFSGLDKNLYFNLYKNEPEFRDLSIFHLVYDGPFFKNPWINENNQRNFLQKGLISAKNGDLIISGDLDEIPKKRIIRKIYTNYNSKTKKKIYSPILINFAFNQNYLFKEPVIATQRLFFYDLVNIGLEDKYLNYNLYNIKDYNLDFTITNIRFYKNTKRLAYGGWHIDYFMTADKIYDKIRSFSHYEDFHTDINKIETYIKSGKFLDEKKLIKINYDYFNLSEFYNLNFQRKLKLHLIVIYVFLKTILLILKGQLFLRRLFIFKKT